MFNWFRKDPEPLRFENNLAAFDYACRHQHFELLLEAVIPALVLEAGTSDPEGMHHFLLRLAVDQGGRELWAPTLKESVAYPQAGDLVGFRVVKIASDLPVQVSVIGFIAVKLEPVLVEGKGWRVVQSYIPQNIRQTVRW